MIARYLALLIVASASNDRPISSTPFIANTANAACWGDLVSIGNNGLIGCNTPTDVIPDSLRIWGINADPAATAGQQSGAAVNLSGGLGVRSQAWTAAQFIAGDTVTITLDGSANVGTEGTSFACVSLSNAVCATNIAAWADALTGIDACAGAGCTDFVGVAGTSYVYRAIDEPPSTTITVAVSRAATATLTAGSDGQIKIPDGTTALPAIAFYADADTGFSRTAANTVCLSVGGTCRWTFDGANAYFDISATQRMSSNKPIIGNSNSLQLGSAATPGHGVTASSVMVGGQLEVDGIAYFDSTVNISTSKNALTTDTTSVQSLTFAANPGDASKTTSGLIPDGAILLGITTRVTTAATNCTSVSIGDGTDVDMFGATTGITQNTTTDNSNATAQFAMAPATAAKEVTITANGGNCFSGVWAVTAHYITVTAATSN